MTAIVQKSNQIDSGHEFGNEGWQKFSVPPEQANQHGCIREIKHVISGRQSAFRQTMETQEFGEHRPAMTGIMAARKRERGESGVGSSVIAASAFTLLLRIFHDCLYQSECGDQRVQERHCVEVHWY